MGTVKKAFQFIRKIVISLLLLLATMLLATVVYFYHYRGQILERVISEVSQKLQCPIQVNHVGLTMLDSFPKLSLVLDGVAIMHAKTHAAPWLRANKVCCSFDLKALLQGQYMLSQVSLAHGRLVWLANEPLPWQSQATISSKQAKPVAPLAVGLHTILLKDMELVYTNKQQDALYTLKTEKIQVHLQFNQQTVQADLHGQATVHGIQAKKLVYNQPIPLTWQAKLSYNQQNQVFTLHQSQLKQEIGNLQLQGRWSNKAHGLVDITMQGKQLAMQKILTYLPANYYAYVQPYAIQGILSLDMQVKKKPGKHHNMGVYADWALFGGQVLAKQFNSLLKLEPVKGQLAIPDIKNLTTGTLDIKEFTSYLGDNKLVSQCSIINLQDFYIQYKAQYELDVASCMQYLPQKSLTKVSGKLVGDWELKASLRQLANKRFSQQGLQVAGKAKSQGICFTFNQLPCTLQDQTNILTLHGDRLVLKNLLGKMGTSDFVLQGTLKNWLPFLWVENAQLDLAGKFYADHLDLDALLPASNPPENKDLAAFTIAPYWVADLSYDIQTLNYKRFCGKQVQGRLTIKDQQLRLENMTSSLAGGKVVCNGFVDAHTDSLNIYTVAQLQGVHLDKLFYNFENFQQHFLEDKHLGGKVFADLMLTLQTDKQGHINWDAFTAEIPFQVYEGVLHHFAPIQQLAEYVAEEHLSHLRFAALKNNIQIKNKVIYIPPMEIYSTITRIQLSGTHSFDGQIAYKLVIPFANFKQKATLQGLEAIGEETLAGLNLHLKLQGDIQNYTITYDTEALKASLKSNVKKQGAVLKEILQGQYVGKQQTKELMAEDYFDFE